MTAAAHDLGARAPHELLDDGHPPIGCDVLVVGCGNILRGDDAVGPTLVRRLWVDGVPDGVRLVDGGTAGMDVAFQMRGAARVVVVDASSTGAEPGTLYRVPGEELAELPPLDGLHTHSFRWDHALAFGRWLLGPECPTDVTVFLVEAGEFTPGGHLSAPVEHAMEALAGLLRREFFPEDEAVADVVEVTAGGYLRMAADVAERWFPAHVCGLRREGEHLLLLPLASAAHGGALLKQRTAAGDRALLVREVLDDDLPVGVHRIDWDDGRGALVVDLAPTGTA